MDKQLDALPVMRRTMEIALERSESSDAPGDGRIAVALSSEAPVERWFGAEILDHSAEAVDLARASGGLPLLLDHDTREQIGVIEDVGLGEDKVLRGLMRFSRSARGQEIRQDVLDGIRTRTSIGYQIREMKLESADKKKGDTYRATKWALLEGSLVAVPADQTVGVGRATDQGAVFPVNIITPAAAPQRPKERTVSEQNTVAQDGATRTDSEAVTTQSAASPTVTSGTDYRGESERAAKITELCGAHGIGQRAAEFIRSGKSVAEVGLEILDTAKRNLQMIHQPVVELSDKEQKSYSLLRAINAALTNDWGKAGFEREVSDETEKRLPSSYQRRGGFFMPTSVRTALAAGTANAAADVVFTEPGSFIDLLRKRMKVRELGASVVGGLRGPVAFPKQSAAGSVAWLAESAAVTESNLTTTQVALNPRTLRARQAYTKQLLAEGVIDVENLIRQDLASIMALEIDRAAITGSGVGAEPTGILNATGVNLVAIGANGGAPTYDHMVDMETAVADDNADVAAMAYLSTSGIRGKLKKTASLANTANIPVWFDGEVNGYGAHVSNQVPSTLAKGTGTNLHAILFGDWSQLVIGEWGALEIQVDPYTRADNGEVVLRTFQMVGLAIRHPEGFAVIKDAATV